jgi:hypothetical protein
MHDGGHFKGLAYFRGLEEIQKIVRGPMVKIREPPLHPFPSQWFLGVEKQGPC